MMGKMVTQSFSNFSTVVITSRSVILFSLFYIYIENILFHMYKHVIILAKEKSKNTPKEHQSVLDTATCLSLGIKLCCLLQSCRSIPTPMISSLI